jgi:hypothetical protein
MPSFDVIERPQRGPSVRRRPVPLLFAMQA